VVCFCHDFCRSRSFSLFRRCSAVDVTVLLAITDPFFIFHLFCLVFLHTCFQCVFNPLFPLMSLSEIVCMFVYYVLVRDRFLYPLLFMLYFGFGVLLSLLNDSIYTKFDSPAPDFPATYTHVVTVCSCSILISTRSG
jgi:hypothetical protein